jgi:tetratricopeptide (TPR) repeat protein
MTNIKNLFTIACISAVITFASCTGKGTDKTSNTTKSTTVVKHDSTGAAPTELDKAMLEHDKKVFAQAIKYDDPYTALYAAHSIIAHDSSYKDQYLDTIAGLYVSLNLPQQSMKIADEVLKLNPENEKMMEIKVSGYMAEGKVDEALAINKKLYDKSKKLKFLFQNAYMQIQMGKLKDAYAIMKQVEAHPNYGTDSVEFQGDAPGQMQKVPVKAANIYLKGYLDIQNQKYPEALQKFKTALNIYPKFFMAKKNMTLLEEGMRTPQPR